MLYFRKQRILGQSPKKALKTSYEKGTSLLENNDENADYAMLRDDSANKNNQIDPRYVDRKQVCYINVVFY